MNRPTPQMTETKYTVRKVTEMLGVSRSTVYRLLDAGPQNGGLAEVRVNRARRVPHSSVVAYLARNSTEES